VNGSNLARGPGREMPDLEAFAALLDVPLIGRTVSVLPLRREHARGLLDAADESLWTYSIARPLESLRDAETFVDEALVARSASREVPFVVVHNGAGRIVGTSRFMQLEPEYASLEIGMTWIGSHYHGTGVNPAMKLLLLTHALDVAGVVRVEFQVDHRNARSRAALAKIGATYEGTLRRYHAHARNGYQRDTMIFSVVDYEWPGVRENLARLVETVGERSERDD
jgi:RimJ/RimL family protein N-acetyltransferase